MGKCGKKNADDVESRPSDLLTAASCTHLLGLAVHNRTHEVDVWRYYCCKRLQESPKQFNFQNKKKTTKKKAIQQSAPCYSQIKKDKRMEKKKDERLVFPKPIQLVMLEV